MTDKSSICRDTRERTKEVLDNHYTIKKTLDFNAKLSKWRNADGIGQNELCNAISSILNVNLGVISMEF